LVNHSAERLHIGVLIATVAPQKIWRRRNDPINVRGAVGGKPVKCFDMKGTHWTKAKVKKTGINIG
jgi:hypothetical protein